MKTCVLIAVVAGLCVSFFEEARASYCRPTHGGQSEYCDEHGCRTGRDCDDAKSQESARAAEEAREDAGAALNMAECEQREEHCRGQRDRCRREAAECRDNAAELQYELSTTRRNGEHALEECKADGKKRYDTCVAGKRDAALEMLEAYVEMIQEKDSTINALCDEMGRVGGSLSRLKDTFKDTFEDNAPLAEMLGATLAPLKTKRRELCVEKSEIRIINRPLSEPRKVHIPAGPAAVPVPAGPAAAPALGPKKPQDIKPPPPIQPQLKSPGTAR